MSLRSRLLLALTAVVAIVGGAWQLGLIRAVAAQAGAIDVRVAPAALMVPVGGTFTVDIVADVGSEMDPGGLGAYEFDLVYDPAYLEVQAVSDAGELGINGRTVVELQPDIDNVSGRTVFGAYTYSDDDPPPDGPMGTVRLATVELTALQVAEAALSLENVVLADTQGMGWPGDGGSLNLQGGTVTIEEAGILGDVNGDGVVNSTDALIILSCAVGYDTAQFCPMDCGDVNNDGMINSTDSLIIVSYAVGYEVPFPVGEPGCPSGVTPCPGCNP